MEENDIRVTEYLRGIGRRGGRKKSEAKALAARENARKATEARWGKKRRKLTADLPFVPLELPPSWGKKKRKRPIVAGIIPIGKKKN